MKKFYDLLLNIFAKGGILVFFIMAFEVMIMISPFAFFFYSIFNPLFIFLGHHTATRWLISFFFPHMILGPTVFLRGIRVLGSVLFVTGFFLFIISALQVYLGKIFKWGIANKGIYKYIRHPQYLFLGIWGVGLVIMWPRFINLVGLAIMMVLYYLLALDEQNRMKRLYGNKYLQYMANTGMFFPKTIEKIIKPVFKIFPTPPLRNIAVVLSIFLLIILSGFLLYNITLDSLPFKSDKNLTLISMLPEDAQLTSNILTELNSAHITLQSNKSYLGYVMPADYLMQGMIANTGTDFHLFKQHHTLRLINEWIFHPFRHLKSSPAFHMAKMHHISPAEARRNKCPLKINDNSLNCSDCPYRRVIILEAANPAYTHLKGKHLLAFATVRTPVFYFDIDTRTGKILNLEKVEKATAWKNVPTPAM